jgi:hypothetical protein
VRNRETLHQSHAGQVLEPIRIFVYGAPSAAVMKALADLNPTYMQLAAGFNR